MSERWKRVTKQDPCPICGKDNWCQFGDRAMKCMRVESPHACDGGGWYHFYLDGKIDFVPKEKEIAPKEIDAYGMMRRFEADHDREFDFVLAEKLGVSVESIKYLGAVYTKKYNAWAFPMRDGNGNIIGIRLRNMSGFKWAVRGSLQGVFIPQSYAVNQNTICYLPEGPTDTLALLSVGLYAIGRPNCMCGAKIINQYLKKIGVNKVVIVADNDEMKHLGPRDGRPGIEGAQKLKKELGMRSCIYAPPSPCKDVRELLSRCKNMKTLIENSVNGKTWTWK